MHTEQTIEISLDCHSPFIEMNEYRDSKKSPWNSVGWTIDNIADHFTESINNYRVYFQKVFDATIFQMYVASSHLSFFSLFFSAC